MRTSQEIILEFRDVLYWSQPNMKHDQMLALINELEDSLHPVEEPIVEAEQVVLMKNEEGIFEEFTVNEEPVVEEHVEGISESLSNILSLLETGAVEEPIVEVVAPKKRPRKV
jgi:hypothetical protein